MPYCPPFFCRCADLPCDDDGYSLLSTMIAMMIVATLALWGMTAYQRQWNNAQLSAAEQQLTSLIALGITHAHQTSAHLVITDSQMPEGFSHWQQGITLRTTPLSAPLLTHHWPAEIVVIGPSHRLFMTPHAFDSTLDGTFLLCTSSGEGRRIIFNRLGASHHEEASAQDCQNRVPRQSHTLGR